MRDARINTIGEGANDVLKAFVGLIGMRDVGLELKGVLDAIKSPFSNVSKITRFAGRKIGSLLSVPPVNVEHSELTDDAAIVGRITGLLGSSVEKLLRKYQEDIVDRQYQLERVADTATEIYVSASVLRRLDFILSDSSLSDTERERCLAAGRYYLRSAARRMHANLDAMWSNEDDQKTALADLMLSSS